MKTGRGSSLLCFFGFCFFNLMVVCQLRRYLESEINPYGSKQLLIFNQNKMFNKCIILLNRNANMLPAS